MRQPTPTLPPPRRAPRRGGVLVEDLLTLSVVALGLIVVAYIYMPDFKRGIWTIANEIGDWVQGY